jgi:hypothetical protein
VAEEKTSSGKSEEKTSPPPPSTKDELVKTDSSKDAASVNRKNGGETVENIIVISNKHEIANLIAQWILAAGAIASVMVVWYMTSQQINQTKSISKSSEADTKKSLALVDSSLRLTKKSIAIADSSLKIAEKNMSLTTEISKTAIQPFIFVDTLSGIQDLQVGKQPFLEYILINVGSTPAYKMSPMSTIMFESDFSQDSMDAYAFLPDTIGWFVGANRKLLFTARFSRPIWTVVDSLSFTKGKDPLLFIIKPIYEDAFGGVHYTQQGYTWTPNKPYWSGLRKYYRTDHDRKIPINSPFKP